MVSGVGTHQGFGLVVLLLPPSSKESHFDINKSSFAILGKFPDHSIQYILDTSILYGVVGCREKQVIFDKNMDQYPLSTSYTRASSSG